MHNRSNFHERYKKSVAVLKRGFAMLGLAVLPVLMLQAEEILSKQELGIPSAFGAVRHEQINITEDNPRHRAIANYFSRRYRIASDALEQLVHAAHITGQKIGVDPLLILSVIAIESRFNPIAESEMGAKGLMQVMPRHHQDKLASVGGDNAVLDPQTNILVGTQILKDCIRRGGGWRQVCSFMPVLMGTPITCTRKRSWRKKIASIKPCGGPRRSLRAQQR